MKPIDKNDYQKRLDRISKIFTEMALHADEQAKHRCPYKNRLFQCTARFGCRNKRKSRAGEELPACASDDQLDYRSAWETDPGSYEQARKQIRTSTSNTCREKV